MKVLVIGIGRIGRVVVEDLVNRDEVTEVGIVDRSSKTLAEIQHLHSKSKTLHALEMAATGERCREVMREFDVGIIALPDRPSSYAAIENAVEARLDVVDILEEYHRRPDPQEDEGLSGALGIDHAELFDYGEKLHERAVRQGVTVLDGVGFAPGLSNISLDVGIRKFDTVRTAISRVGGIPSKESARTHPLGYMLTWSFAHVIREYTVGGEVLKDGKRTVAPPMSDLELFDFVHFGKNEQFECAVTPGMPSFPYTRPELRNFCEKTVRWPGHFAAIETLKSCGLLNESAIEFKGQEIQPRAFVAKVLEPRLAPSNGESDMCVMLNTIEGVKDGKPLKIDYYLWEEADTDNGISAMARVTAYPAVAAAILMARGRIEEKGIVAPEDALSGDLYGVFSDELRKRDVVIDEVVTEIS